MTFATAFTTVGAVLGIFGLAVLAAAAVFSSIADLTGRDLATAPVERSAERLAERSVRAATVGAHR